MVVQIDSPETFVEPLDIWRTEVVHELHTNEKLREIISEDLYEMYEDHRESIKRDRVRQKLAARATLRQVVDKLLRKYRQQAMGTQTIGKTEEIVASSHRKVHKKRALPKEDVSTATTSTSHGSVSPTLRRVSTPSVDDLSARSQFPTRVRRQGVRSRRRAHRTQSRRARVVVRTGAGYVTRIVRNMLRRKISSRALFGSSMPKPLFRAEAVRFTKHAPSRDVAKGSHGGARQTQEKRIISHDDEFLDHDDYHDDYDYQDDDYD